MLLNKKAALLVSILVLNSWVGAVLAGKDSRSLTVQAQLKPASCEILLNGKTNTTLNFGKIHQYEIKQAKENIAVQDLTLTINCTDKTLATLSVSDDNNHVRSHPDHYHFIVINQKKEEKGLFSLRLKEFTASDNDVSSHLIASKTGKDYTWKKISSGSYLNPENSNPEGKNQYISLGATSFGGIPILSTIYPTAFKKLEIPLEVEFRIYKEYEIKDIESIEGRASFVLKYI